MPEHAVTLSKRIEDATEASLRSSLPTNLICRSVILFLPIQKSASAVLLTSPATYICRIFIIDCPTKSRC